MKESHLKWITRLYWLSAFSFLIYFILVNAPKKGFDLSDHGVYLSSANNFLYGVFNEYGLSDFINSILIKLGFNYLNMAQFFYCLEFFSGLFFVISLRLRSSVYWIVPLAVTMMLASSAVHLISYESAGPILLMLATSFLFITINYKLSNFWKNICYLLSAFLYAYSSVTNLILVPSLLTNAIILFFIYPKIRNTTFIATYLISAAVGLYLIIFKVLPLFNLTEFYQPHYISWVIPRIFGYIFQVVLFILSGFFGTKLIAFTVAKAAKLTSKVKLNTTNINTIALILATIGLWIGVRVYKNNSYAFDGWENSLLVYGYVYLGVITAIYGWRFYKDKTLTLLAVALLFHTQYYLAMGSADGMLWSIRSLGHASQICLIVLVWLEYCFIQDGNKNTLRKLFVTVPLFLSISFALYIQLIYAYGQFPNQDTAKVVNIKRLNGLYVQPGQLKSMDHIVAAYYKNDCQNKLFISRKEFSLFYYIFNRIGYSPLYLYDSKDDLARLNHAESQKRGYCFFGDIFFENKGKQVSNISHPTATHKLYLWLQAHSKKVIYLPIADSCCVKNLYLKLYVG